MEVSAINPFSVVTGIIALVTAVLSFWANAGKANKSDTKALEEKVATLQQIDIGQQRELNKSTIEIEQLKYKNRLQEEKLLEYYQIITDKDPSTKEALAVLTNGVNTIIERLDGAEVTQDEPNS